MPVTSSKMNSATFVCAVSTLQCCEAYHTRGRSDPAIQWTSATAIDTRHNRLPAPSAARCSGAGRTRIRVCRPCKKGAIMNPLVPEHFEEFYEAAKRLP